MQQRIALTFQYAAPESHCFYIPIYVCSSFVKEKIPLIDPLALPEPSHQQVLTRSIFLRQSPDSLEKDTCQGLFLCKTIKVVPVKVRQSLPRQEFPAVIKS